MAGDMGRPHVAYAVDDDKWGDVVLNTYYPHDANACDAVQAGQTGPVYGRCFWEGSRWNCPGACVSGDGAVTIDGSAVGASSNSCRSCHFDGENKVTGDWWVTSWTNPTSATALRQA
ncbi:unnamed protein product [Prorocentrum cordatum]|uniref:Cellulase n=1 Tax=Prorocentrum cordatum TaxID=2364126 RepID=A0ABN9TC57_9DINO|nr:unnamed protein product [Polarella glacialis]